MRGIFREHIFPRERGQSIWNQWTWLTHMLKVITAINSSGKSSEQNQSYTFSKEQEALMYYSSRHSEQTCAGLASELVHSVLASKQQLIRCKFSRMFHLLTTLFNCSVLFWSLGHLCSGGTTFLATYNLPVTDGQTGMNLACSWGFVPNFGCFKCGLLLFRVIWAII